MNPSPSRRWPRILSQAFALLTVVGEVTIASEHPPVRDEPIRPIPRAAVVDAGLLDLGERLFNDASLSHDGKISCAMCHQLKQGGDDGLPRSLTNTGRPDVANAPTVFNSGLNSWLVWNGRFRSLEAQIKGAITNPRHFNTTWQELSPKLHQDDHYSRAFARHYPDGITENNLLHAIATYEGSLRTPDSRFDRWLRGADNAITTREQHGYQIFKSYGCVSCHQGVNVGGNLLQKLGVFEDYFTLRGGPLSKSDLGRYVITGDEDDRHVFRVPSLRNVEVTAPYFHDGSVATLPDAIRLMGRLQLGIRLPEEDIESISAFLRTLTGEFRGQSLSPLSTTAGTP